MVTTAVDMRMIMKMVRTMILIDDGEDDDGGSDVDGDRGHDDDAGDDDND